MGSKINENVEIGAAAPDFELVTNTGESWRLSDHLGKVVALLFYPGDETLVCTKQLCSVRDHWNDYVETKAVVVGVSPGTADDHAAFAEHHRLPIPLLADGDSEVTETYCSHWLFPLFFMRGIVIVDAKGIVRTRRTMLRAFRPSDRSVITAIYAARGDALQEKYKDLATKGKADS